MGLATAARSELVARVYSDPPAGWDEFVSGSNTGTVYHMGAWQSVMTDVMGHECRYLVAQNGDGEIRGILPVVHVRSHLFGNHLVSMPFLNAGGPIGTAPALSVLTKAVVDEAKRLNVRSVELRSRSVVEGGLRQSARKITVVLPLPATEDELWKSLHAKLRANVKRAAREGVELRYGASEVGAFYDVFARNMRDLGTPVLPLSFFERIAASLSDHVIFSSAYWNGVPIAGQCSFVWGDELEMVWGSSLREHNRLKVTTLIHWEFMKRGIALGLKSFNFGRCTPDSGTHEFKKRWGGIDEPLPWTSWSRTPNAAMASPDSPKYRLAISAWQRLPLHVANLVGPVLSRRLP